MTVLRDYAAGLGQPALGSGSDAGSDAAGRYDEVVGPDGALRAAWKPLAEPALTLRDDDLARVHDDMRRALADAGVTASRSGEAARPWPLDPVPLVLGTEEWAVLDVGLAQRAELLNAVLADLYGPRRLLADGVVPAAVVLAHPGFVRVVARAGASDPRPLVLAAAELGRDRDGGWRVLADRTQAPSGLGYVLANRRATSRVLPELFREAGVHRIDPFVHALRSALLQSAPADLADPRVVVLTPGSASPTAYDQAALATALGFPLVRGSDLVVHDGWLHLRVAGRLERVDVVLRRVDAVWSDPLELRADSRLGVAGLAECVRRGRVRVVNGLGAGVLESPALLPFLPAACEALLGEPLRLPSVPAWWCGDRAGLGHVLDHPDEVELRHLDGTGAPHGLDAAGRAALVHAAPHEWVGRARLPLSSAPLRHADGRVRPGRLTLRTFTLRYGSAYRPLAGGLASVVEGEGEARRVVASKDVWVRKAAPTVPDQGLPEVLPTTHGRALSAAVPRVLEDMFWAGRYAERAEALLRLVLAAHALADDYRDRPRTTGAQALDVVLGAVHRLAGPGPVAGHDADLDADFRSVLLDRGRVGSVAHAVAGLRAALAGVRDQLSRDVWRVFGTTDRAAGVLAASRHSHQVEESAGRMLTGLLALHGVTGSMVRDPGWHMLAVGRSVERGLQVCQLLAATTTLRRGLEIDREVLGAVLTAAESAVTHRRRYRGVVRPGGVLELLLADTDNPRSLAWALDQLVGNLAAMPTSTGSTRPERLVADLQAEVLAVDIAALVAIGGVGRPNLDAFLRRVVTQLTTVAAAVAEVHHSTGPAPRPLVPLVAAP